MEPTFWTTDLRGGFAVAKDEERFLIAVFTDAESPASALFERETLRLSPMIKALEDFVRVRLDSETDRGYALFYRIQQFPTVVFFDSEGRELDRFSGFADVQTMLRRCIEAVDPKTNYVKLKERLRVNPVDVEALYYMGYKYTRRNDHDRAMAYFERVEEVDPQNKHEFFDNILVRRAEAAEQKGETQEALDLLKDFRARFPDSDEMERADYQRGRLLWLSGDAAAAHDAFRAFLQTYPESEFRSLVEAAALMAASPPPAVARE